MKVFLFGGYETKLNQLEDMYRLIGEQITTTGCKNILHIPFAFQKATFADRHRELFSVLTQYIPYGFNFIDASCEADIDQIKSCLVLISGGQSNSQLLQEIQKRSYLLEYIKNTKYLMGSSAGAMVLGKFVRMSKPFDHIIEGLGILPQTIIEPHYTERKRKEGLLMNMEKSGAKCGIGIDCVTGLSFDLVDFPHKYEKIGEGQVKVLTS